MSGNPAYRNSTTEKYLTPDEAISSSTRLVFVDKRAEGGLRMSRGDAGEEDEYHPLSVPVGTLPFSSEEIETNQPYLKDVFVAYWNRKGLTVVVKKYNKDLLQVEQDLLRIYRTLETDLPFDVLTRLRIGIVPR